MPAILLLTFKSIKAFVRGYVLCPISDLHVLVIQTETTRWKICHSAVVRLFVANQSFLELEDRWITESFLKKLLS